jgi:NAD(P)-dependent dehydrogenase (short-subunit alcohol dehydrogenase family)
MKTSRIFAFALSLIVFLPFTVAADDGQVVLITGANRGIGLEFVQQLSAKGFEVIGTARNPAKATELKATGARVEQLDVTDGASVVALAQSLDGVAITPAC